MGLGRTLSLQPGRPGPAPEGALPRCHRGRARDPGSRSGGAHGAHRSPGAGRGAARPSRPGRSRALRNPRRHLPGLGHPLRARAAGIRRLAGDPRHRRRQCVFLRSDGIPRKRAARPTAAGRRAHRALVRHARHRMAALPQADDHRRDQRPGTGPSRLAAGRHGGIAGGGASWHGPAGGVPVSGGRHAGLAYRRMGRQRHLRPARRERRLAAGAEPGLCRRAAPLAEGAEPGHQPGRGSVQRSGGLAGCGGCGAPAECAARQGLGRRNIGVRSDIRTRPPP